MATNRWKHCDLYSYPPLQSIKITTNEGEVTASPFKRGKNNNEPVNIEDIKKIYHQNNYSNQMLHTIANQIDSLSTEIKGIQKESNPKFPLSYSAPHFQPTSLPIEKIQPINLLGQITQALEKINENIPSTSKINTIEEQEDSTADSAEENSASDDSIVQQIN